MRIGILCYPTYGGSGVVATELGKALAARGHTVHFVNHQLPVRLQGDGFAPELYFHEVSVPNYPLFVYPPYTLALTGRLVQVVKEYGLDIVHAHYAVPHSLVAVLARQIVQTVKVVTTLHGTDITLVGSEPAFMEVTRHAITASDGVTAVSNALAQDTRDMLEVENDIRTLYNFVDLEHYRRREDNPRSIYAAKGQKVVIHISNFRPVKRLQDVLAVFARINRQLDAVLLLVGDGPEACRARAVARELGLCDKVIFLGQQREIVPLLSAADLMLLPSEKESFGLVALEAMACGVPVVASKVGGLPEVVEPDGGRLCPLGDVDAMAAASLDILADLPRWRAGARRRAEAFDSGQGVDAYEQFYRQVLAGD